MPRETLRSRLGRILRPSPRSEVEEELAFHLAERKREFEALGMTPEEARAAAAARLGDLGPVREECTALLSAERRSEARREWLKLSWLDFRLGFRMLVKYPGLTIIGGLAMAFAIWVGAGTFEFIRQVVDPALLLDGGDRVVGVVLLDAERSRVERRAAADFVRWRGELRTLSHLGAFRTLDRNLVTEDGLGHPVSVAEITAAGFDVTRVAPRLGRGLVPSDERPGAPPVVVLGYDVWQERLGADPDIVGKTVRLGRLQPTVVGVMPAGFRFPVRQQVWLPLGGDVLDQEERQGPALYVFGRLAPGVSLEEAQAELTTVGQRTSADHPETHRHIRPRVLPYARSIFYMPSLMAMGLGATNLFVVMLLVLICGNVALLVFARAATRESELLVRTALGAGRGRILTQFFVEALVLGGVAAAVGLAGAGAGLRWMYGTLLQELAGDSLPFWVEPRLSAATVGYTLLLTLIAAAIAGIVPALKVTGRKVEVRLKELGTGAGGLRLGGVWTAVIVAQIAATVLFPLFVLQLRSEGREIRSMPVNFPEEEFISARLEMDSDVVFASASGVLADFDVGPAPGAEAGGDAPEVGPLGGRYAAVLSQLERRLESSSGIAGVTFGDRLPRMYHPHRLVEVDSGGAAPLRPEWPAYRVSNVTVAPDYFDEMQVSVLAGRDFHAGDLGENVRAVIVNRSFVEKVLGDRNPIGRRVRYVHFEEEPGMRDATSQPWYEIVGVVPDMGLSWGDYDPKSAGIYHPAPPGGVYPMHAAIRVSGEPAAVVHELRAIAAVVDPALRVYEPMPMERLDDSELRFYSFWFWITLLLSAIAVTLSLAGIYAAMSFAVSRRTREIGIRLALGAGRRRIVASIFRGPLRQVAAGLALGLILIVALAEAMEGNVLTPRWLLLLTLYMACAAAVCTLACVLPTRRALRVEPAEALRTD